MKNFQFIEHINKINMSPLFSNDCLFYLRNCVIRTIYPEWEIYNIKHLFLYKGKLSLYPNLRYLSKIYLDYLKIETNIDLYAEEKILDIISKDGYVNCLYDTYNTPNHMNYNSVHNYNSLLIVGADNNKYKIYISPDYNNFIEYNINYKELLYICDLKKEFSTNDGRDYACIGLPFSAMYLKEKVNFEKNISSADLIIDINNFYFNTKEEMDIKLVESFLINIIDYMKECFIYKHHYFVIHDIKILIDFFSLLNLKINYSKNEKYKVVILMQNEICKNLKITMGKYIKCVYKHGSINDILEINKYVNIIIENIKAIQKYLNNFSIVESRG